MHHYLETVESNDVLEENEDIMGGSIENPEAVQQFMQNVKVLYDSVTALIV
jgi:hypothetical protein